MAKKKAARYAIGVDYGTSSVRALIVRLQDGEEVGTSVVAYPTGVDGVIVDPKDPHLARQNPADYMAGFTKSVRGAMRKAKKTDPDFAPEHVTGLGVDTTGSTPIPVDALMMPLALHEEFRDDPAAHAWLWKDHTSVEEAAKITALASKSKRTPYLGKCGGTYSSEWYWAKVLHCARTAPKVSAAASAWVELADFVPAWLCGHRDPITVPRGVCAAGHKAMWHRDWGGVPSSNFLGKLDPELVRFGKTFDGPIGVAGERAGTMTTEIARSVGLPPGLPVSFGAFDAHMGAVGAGVKPGTLVKIIGTSTCDITVAPLDAELPDIPGLCGIVPESVMAGTYGLEAGQSAVGDIFNWFVNQFAGQMKGTAKGDPHKALTREAAKQEPGASGLLALDWNNGNRTVLVDQQLSGLVLGQTLHTTPAETYRALIEATAFGALRIIEQFENHGVHIRDVINCGGIAEKNPLLMQIYADVTNRPMKISRSAQTCALGAAMFGAIAGGGFRSVRAAQKAMTGVSDTVYKPRKAAAKTYAELYGLYHDLHDAFGVPKHKARLDHVMKDLFAIRRRVTGGAG